MYSRILIIKKYIFLINCLAIMSMLSENIYSQSLEYNNLYLENKQILNPAFTGEQVYPKFFLSYMNASKSIDSIPESIILSTSFNITDKAALGGRFYRNNFKLYNSTSTFIDYSYTLSFSELNKLRLGVSAGINTHKKNIKNNMVDSLFIRDEMEGVHFEISAGLTYTYKNFEWSLAVQDLIRLKDTTGYAINSMLIYALKLNQQGFTLRPGILAIYTPEKFLFDINLQVQLSDALWFGATYRSSDAIVASTGVNYGRFALSYALQLQSQKDLIKPIQIHQLSVSFTLSNKKLGDKNGDLFSPIVKLFGKKNWDKTNSAGSPYQIIEKKDTVIENSVKQITLKRAPKTKNSSKKKYSIVEIGKGIFIVKAEINDSLNKRLAVSGQEIANEDSIIMSNLLDYIDKEEINNNYELIEIGKGMFIVKSASKKNNISGEEFDSLIINSGLFEQFEEVEGINTDSEKNKSYTIQLDINDKNIHLLTSPDISGNLFAKRKENGEVHYYYGQYKSIGAALKYKEQLKKYDNLNTKIVLINTIE